MELKQKNCGSDDLLYRHTTIHVYLYGVSVTRQVGKLHHRQRIFMIMSVFMCVCTSWDVAGSCLRYNLHFSHATCIRAYAFVWWVCTMIQMCAQCMTAQLLSFIGTHHEFIWNSLYIHKYMHLIWMNLCALCMSIFVWVEIPDMHMYSCATKHSLYICLYASTHSLTHSLARSLAHSNRLITSLSLSVRIKMRW